MWETWVQSLGREDPLEKGMATHSSILTWNSMDRRTWRHTVHQGSVRVRVTKSRTRLRGKHFSFFLWGREVGGSNDNQAVQEGVLQTSVTLADAFPQREWPTLWVQQVRALAATPDHAVITFSLTDSPHLDCEPWALFISGSPASLASPR